MAFNSDIDSEKEQIRRNTMTSFRRLSIVVAAFLLVIGVASAASTQTAGGPGRGQAMYDVTTETTITGTIESVETATATRGGGGQALGGTHLRVKTEKESLLIAVGPTAYLAEKAITFEKGDTVEILGSRVTVDKTPMLIAKQIKKGGTAWTLRDASGRPLWSGRAR
jgi:hypothetical protein